MSKLLRGRRIAAGIVCVVLGLSLAPGAAVARTTDVSTPPAAVSGSTSSESPVSQTGPSDAKEVQRSVPRRSLRVQVVQPLSGRASVIVRGPKGFRTELSRSTTLRSVPKGKYRVSAVTVTTTRHVSKPAISERQVTAGGKKGRLVEVSYFNAVSRRVAVVRPGVVKDYEAPTGADDGQLISREQYAKGSILAGGVGKETPAGFLLRVTGREQSGKTYLYSVEQASLDMAVPRGEFSAGFTVPLDGTSAAVTAAAATIGCTGSVTGPSLTPQGGVDLVAAGRWGAGGPEFSVVVSPYASMRATLAFEAEVACSGEVSVIDRQFKPIVVNIGTIPLVIVPRLKLAVGAELKAWGRVGLVHTSEFRSVLRGAVGGSDPGFSATWPKYDDDTEFTPDGDVEGEVYVRANIMGEIYGVGGPYAELRLATALHVASVDNPWWTITGSLTGRLGIAIDKCVKVLMAEWCVGWDKGADVLKATWLLAAAPGPRPGPVPETDELLAAINAARAQGRWCGAVQYPAVVPLQRIASLDRAAQKYASRMAAEDFLDHISPDGDGPVERAAAEGYTGPLGEGLAGGPDTAQRTVDAWVGSPGHCRSLMTAQSIAGLGFARSSTATYDTYWVFMGDCSCAGATTPLTRS